MKKKNIYYLFSFMFPVLLLTIVYAVIGIYPFGDKTLINGDCQGQYVYFYSYLHEMLHGNAGFGYTFSKAVGGNMVDIISYYLASPFNLVFYFFEKEQTPVVILMISYIKIGMLGLCMYWNIRHFSKRAFVLVFSTAYALSGWVIAYQFEAMWLDGAIILPLMIYYLSHFEEKKYRVCYIVTLTLAILSNYYIGYMLCLISVIYFVVYRALINRNKISRKMETKLWLWYVFDSCLAGGLSLFFVFPTILALRTSKMGYVSFQHLIEFNIRFAWKDLLFKIFPGSFTPDQLNSDSIPLIYCGILSAVSCILFFLFKKGIREKIGYGIIFVILLVSMFFNGPYQVWHGCAYPAGYQTRFSFIYIFFVIYTAVQFWTERIENSKLSEKKYTSSILCILTVVLSIGAFAEYTWNTIDAYHKFTFMTMDEYESDSLRLAKIDQMIDKDAAEREQGFFRVAYADGVNDGWMYHKASLSSYSSCENGGLRLYMKNLGLTSNGAWLNYGFRNTPELLASLLGTQYYVMRNPDVNDSLSFLGEDNGYYLYRTEDTFDLGFFVTKDAIDASFSTNYPIERLTVIWNSLYGQKENPLAEEIPLDEIIDSSDGEEMIITLPDDEIYYLYMDINEDKNVYQEQETERYSQINFHSQIVDFSMKKTGSSSQFYLESMSSDQIENMKLYRINREEMLHRIRENSNELLNKTIRVDSKSNIVIDTVNKTGEEQYLLLTIPTEPNCWMAICNGEKTKTLIGFEQLSVLKIPEGESHITLKYIPRGFVEGCVASILAGIVFLGILVQYCIGKKSLQKEE